MRKLLTENNLKYIKVIFIFVSFLTIVLTLFETYTYKNFFYNHFYISTDLLLVFTFFLGIITFFEPDNIKKNTIDRLHNLYVVFVMILSGLLIIVYFPAKFYDELYYQNYIFSRFHIQTDLILRPITLGLFLISISLIKKYFRLLFSGMQSFLSLTLLVVVAVFGLNNLIFDLSVLIPNVYAINKTKTLSFDEKTDYIMNDNYGDFYKYTQFIKSIVPEGDSIVLPPQKNPWQYEGNQRLVRYFLYPRTLYSAHENLENKKINYALIAWGNSIYPPKGDNLYGWPRYDMSAKNIYIYDMKTGVVDEYKGNYKFEEYLKEGTYGLIKL